jgi:hypothetical protein
MGKNPAFQFYPSDWSRDLEEHPLDIEGAWIRICCKLWWSENPGNLTKTLPQWAKILRESSKKTDKILKYLSSNSICDLLNQNGDITVISRRMVRDEYIRKIRKEAGEKGGNPALKKDIDLLNQISNQNASKSQPLHLQSSSSTSYSKKKNKYIPSYTEDFLLFWNLYPQRNGHKPGKKDAFDEWQKLGPPTDLQTEIMCSLNSQIKYFDDCRSHDEFCPEFPDACRWIKKRRWEDEVKTRTQHERIKESLPWTPEE